VLADVAAAWGRGELVVVPTETVYGVAASARSAAGVARLREASGNTGALTWHAADVDAVRRVVDLPTAVHRRLVSKLAPGPVRFVFEQPAQRLGGARGVLGVEPGVIDDGSTIAVRVPSHAVGSLALAAGEGPVVAERTGALGVAAERSAPEPGSLSSVSGVPVALVIDSGAVAGTVSTTVRVGLTGAFEVAAGGPLGEADVLRSLERTVAFVCTGNTCRSPMAEAIARGVLARAPASGITTRVVSAGVAAGPGLPATPEAARAVESLGYEMGEHRSRSATAALLSGAEAVFAMTADHLRMLTEASPSLADRATLLDPEGDIPDPIGGPYDLYEQTARRIEAAVTRRLQELEP